MKETIFIQNDLIDENENFLTNKYCCPIYITGMYGTIFSKKDDLIPHLSDKPSVRNGTLTFIELDGSFFGITCAHVIEELERQNSLRKERLSNLFNTTEVVCWDGDGVLIPEAALGFYVPHENGQIHINTTFKKFPKDEFTQTGYDLAIAPISKEKLEQLELCAIPLNDIPDLSTDFSKNIGGIATGYPENQRGYVNKNGQENFGYSLVNICSPFNSITNHKISLIYELLTLDPGINSLSGMSGGPIFWTGKEGWYLIGIIVEGKDMNPKSTDNQQSVFKNSTIWITGERLTKKTVINILNSEMGFCKPLKDLSKVVIIPSNKRQ